jgi:hypothetical protein
MKTSLACLSVGVMLAAPFYPEETKAQDLTRTFVSPLLDITVGVQFGETNQSNRIQTSQVNVYGVGQVGRNNQAGVIQVGEQNVAHIKQVGPISSAYVGQTGIGQSPRLYANIVQISNGWVGFSGSP